MLLRVSVIASLVLLTSGILGSLAGVIAEAATYSPHGQNASGWPYYGGQIQDNNYTFYATERDTAMNNWQTATGRRYIDGFTSGEVMSQYVVYAGSQQDTDLANTFHINSCAYLHDHGYSGWNSISFGFGSKNNDSSMHAICLFTSAYGYSPAFDQLTLTTRKRGLTHEMGHSLHLADDQADTGTMNRCWCYSINTTEANYVNYIYAISP